MIALAKLKALDYAIPRAYKNCCVLLARRHASASANSPFKEGERVLMRLLDREPILTDALSSGKIINTHRGVFAHDAIIGKFPRDSVVSSSGKLKLRLSRPSLSDYVRFHPRVVTPIYPADASLLVSLLDLHPEGRVLGDSLPQYEILEAGTGNGFLTLYLARAIHAANITACTEISQKPATSSHDTNLSKPLRGTSVIHTVDLELGNTRHAQRVVAGYRNGLYLPDIAFHTGNVSCWISEHLLAQKVEQGASEEFLSHIILDLPSAEDHLRAASQVLRTDGSLVVFNPSITQISEVFKAIRTENLPLQLETVIELGQGMTGGREWKLEWVKGKSKTKGTATSESSLGKTIAIDDQADSSDPATEELRKQESEKLTRVTNSTRDDGLLVCRPKPGSTVVGGGFIGLWKKKSCTVDDDCPTRNVH